MVSEKTKSTDIKIRLSLEEKDVLKQSAESVGVSMSDFIRSAIFSDEKVVLLTEGKSIAAELFRIQKELAYFHSCGNLPQDALESLKEAFEDIILKLVQLMDKVTDIGGDENE